MGEWDFARQIRFGLDILSLTDAPCASPDPRSLNMSRIGAPHPSSAAHTQRLQSTLERLRQKNVEQTKAPSIDEGDTFSTKGPKHPVVATTLPSPGPLVGPSIAGLSHGALGTRLAALTGKSNERVLTGEIRIERASDLARLAGVTKLEGSLSIAECALEARDLQHAKSLVTITGGLSVEGASHLTSIDAFAALQTVGGALYVGFNRALESLSLPALAHVGRAFVVEGNARLQSFSAPLLKDVSGYLHVHENPRLVTVSLPALASASGELSFVDCPLLARIDAPLLAVARDLEAIGLGGATLALAS